MKLTNATEQAVAVIAIIATQQPNLPVSSASIYQKLAVSPSYVQKLLRKLVVAKLIQGVSGNNGGFYLEKQTTEISLLEIVEAIEGKVETFPDMGVLERAFAGFDEYAHDGHRVVKAHFKEADEAWRQKLREISVHQVLEHVFQQADGIPSVNWN